MLLDSFDWRKTSTLLYLEASGTSARPAVNRDNGRRKSKPLAFYSRAFHAQFLGGLFDVAGPVLDEYRASYLP
jgi:hypothetical protein